MNSDQIVRDVRPIFRGIPTKLFGPNHSDQLFRSSDQLSAILSDNPVGHPVGRIGQNRLGLSVLVMFLVDKEFVGQFGRTVSSDGFVGRYVRTGLSDRIVRQECPTIGRNS